MNRSRIAQQLRFITNRENANLFGREPEREIAGVVLDQKSDTTFMGAEWGPMNTKRRLLFVVAVLINEVQPARLREIDLVGGDSKLTSDHTPDLHVNFRPIEGCFVSDFNVIDPGVFEDATRHFLGLFPKLRFINKLLTESSRIVGREPHQVFID